MADLNTADPYSITHKLRTSDKHRLTAQPLLHLSTLHLRGPFHLLYQSLRREALLIGPVNRIADIKEVLCH